MNIDQNDPSDHTERTSNILPADTTAERIVRHFQAEGFVGISEALIIRVCLRSPQANGHERAAIKAAFRHATDEGRPPPVDEYFEIRPYGHFSSFRSFAEAKTAIRLDFSVALRAELPRIYFEPLPVIVDDALATGTRHDAMIKLCDNVGEFAFAVLVNDPDSSLFEYLGTHHGNDWLAIIGEFQTVAASSLPGDKLI